MKASKFLILTVCFVLTTVSMAGESFSNNGLEITKPSTNEARPGQNNLVVYIDQIKKGSYSDDTQLMLCILRCIKSAGNSQGIEKLIVDSDIFSKHELVNWINYSRGAGATIKNAAELISPGTL